MSLWDVLTDSHSSRFNTLVVLFFVMMIDDRPKTTSRFSVGDKVYVAHQDSCYECGKLKDTYTVFTNHIRATITEIDDRWGYHLRAFRQDLPGIYMYNVWDYQLSPRISKANKPFSKCSCSREEKFVVPFR